MGTGTDTTAIRVGGMAMPDGVFMRTDRAWAVARGDGSVETGTLPANPVARIPIIRLFASIGQSIGAAMRRSVGRGRDPRLLIAMAGIIAIDRIVAWTIGPFGVAGWGESLYHVWLLGLALTTMKLITPRSLWRYHGAEHKAIGAYESGIPMRELERVAKVSPIHDRCGTNLVFLIAFVLALPLPAGPLGSAARLLGVGLAAEALVFAVRRHPKSIATKAMVSGGRLLQRAVTIRQPRLEELAVGCHALEACIAAHEEAVAADTEAGQPDPETEAVSPAG